jgi:transcriptional antiterminator NusG
MPQVTPDPDQPTPDTKRPAPADDQRRRDDGADAPVTDAPMTDAEPALAPDAPSAAAPVAEAAAASAAPPAPVKAGKVKKLTAGRAAVAASSSTLASAGIATSKALLETAATTRKRGKKSTAADPASASAAAKPAADASDAAAASTSAGAEPFDPAVDLPMYRPGMDWFVLRVASNKESYVRETLLRKVQIEGLTDMVGRIMVPTEKVKTLKGGKHRITENKLYPGYVFVEMRLEPDGRIPQDVFFLIKETTGVGDFVGTAGRPTPMAATEVEKMLFDSRKPEEAPTVRMEFHKGDHVTIKEGPFENYTGTVDEVMPDKGLVRVLVTIFGRQAPIDIEYWQLAKAEG